MKSILMAILDWYYLSSFLSSFFSFFPSSCFCYIFFLLEFSVFVCVCVCQFLRFVVLLWLFQSSGKSRVISTSPLILKTELIIHISCFLPRSLSFFPSFSFSFFLSLLWIEFSKKEWTVGNVAAAPAATATTVDFIIVSAAATPLTRFHSHSLLPELLSVGRGRRRGGRRGWRRGGRGGRGEGGGGDGGDDDGDGGGVVGQFPLLTNPDTVDCICSICLFVFRL